MSDTVKAGTYKSIDLGTGKARSTGQKVPILRPVTPERPDQSRPPPTPSAARLTPPLLRQSFSHGRKNVVVVEVKKRKITPETKAE